MNIRILTEANEVDREKAKRLISGLFDQPADNIDTDSLKTMRQELESKARSARVRGIFHKLVDALDTEIQARGGSVQTSVHPQTQAETVVAGGPDDVPGEIRHGVMREASIKWRVTGR